LTTTRKPRPPRRKKKLDAEPLALLAAEAADAMKALEITVLRVSEIVNYTDYFVICSGRSTKHTQSIAENVQRAFAKTGKKPLGVEGEREGEWILADFGDIIVHVFYHPVREFYDLEKLYGDAKRVPGPKGEPAD
jgi:ribosome-associated protein